MTVDEAKAYLETLHQESNDSLRAFADEAMRTALVTLKKVAKAGPRVMCSKSEDGSFDSFSPSDVTAATALLRAGIDARKLLKGSRSGPPGSPQEEDRDLFDTPWTFKEES